MRRCVLCHKRLWFWQKREKVPDPFTGGTSYIVLPLHKTCHDQKLKEIVINAIKAHEARQAQLHDQLSGIANKKRVKEANQKVTELEEDRDPEFEECEGAEVSCSECDWCGSADETVPIDPKNPLSGRLCPRCNEVLWE